MSYVDDEGRQTFAFCTADVANQIRLLQTRATIKKIAAVGAKHQ